MRISRRKFIKKTATGAAGLGLAACDKRKPTGPDIRMPKAPEGLAAEAADQKVTLTWDKHDLTDITGNPTETAISEYRIYRDSGFVGKVQNTVYQDNSGLVNGQSYAYQVSAVDASGNESPLSKAINSIPMLKLSSQIMGGSIMLIWFPKSDVVRQNYQVFRRRESESIFSQIHETGESQYQDTSVEEDVKYYYYLIPVDQNGSQEYQSTQIVASTRLVRIYKVIHTGVNSGMTIHGDKVTAMLHEGVKVLTGKSDVGEAYASLFPDISVQKIIAVKINCLAGGGGMLSTHPEVVEAIVDGLTRMLNGTFPSYNIIVFDDRDTGKISAAGFTLRDEPGAYRVVTTENNWSSTVTQIDGYPPGTTYAQRFSKIVEQADYIINVPVLKGHNQAGITFSLKNFYGIVSDPGNMHDPLCNPMIASVYEKVADKVKLIVGDCIFGSNRSTPYTSPTFMPQALLVGTDPVAMDYEALCMINDERSSKISEAPTGDARHISTAAEKPYYLGVYGTGLVKIETLEVSHL